MDLPIKERRKHQLKAKLVSLDEFWEKEKDNFFKDIKPTIKPTSPSSSPLVQNFEEVIAFYVLNQRLPSNDASEFAERVIARKFSAVLKAKDNIELQKMDVHGLLSEENSASSSNEKVTEIDFNDEDALLDLINNQLGNELTRTVLDTSKLSRPKNSRADTAKRLPCPDFHQYMPVFEAVRKLIDNREANIEAFQGYANKIAIGDVFIWDGLTCFVAEEVKMEFDPKGNPNPRLRVIFDNGMFADLLMQSMSQGMYRSKNSRRITQNMTKLLGKISTPLEEKYGKKTGEIYFLSSASNSSSVKQFDNLIKIGVTTKTTPQRIKNADMEATYLFAPVKILKILPCYNMDVNSLESLIHASLHEYRKSIRISNQLGGKVVEATEWFDVPLNIAIDTALSIIKKSHPNYQSDDHGNVYS
jgi:hypothetical protein